jgi:adenylate kinase family enzyme
MDGPTREMQRILVIGSGGAGKSTLARRLGERLALPVVHLDAMYWRGGWTTPSKDEWVREVARLIAADAWVIDGNYTGTLDLRIPAADTIIFLDFPRILCLWRVVERRFLFRGRSRPDMHPECPERLTWQFIDWIWNYPRRQRPRVLERLRAVAAEKRVIILESPSAVEEFVAGIESPVVESGRRVG